MLWMTPATGLAALNAKKPKHPYPGDDNRMPDKKDGKKNNQTKLPPFMPGQKAGLVQQLNQGFGGGRGQWRGYLNDIYSAQPYKPFVPMKRGGGGGGKDKDKDGAPVDDPFVNPFDNPLGPGVVSQPAALPQGAMQGMPPVGLLALAGRRW